MIPYCAILSIILLCGFEADGYTDGNYLINNRVTYNNPYYNPYINVYPNVYNQIGPYPYWPFTVQRNPYHNVAPYFQRPFYVKCGIVSHLYVCCAFSANYRCMPLAQIYPAVKEPEDYDYNDEDLGSGDIDGNGSDEGTLPPPAKRFAPDDFEFGAT